MRGDGKRWVTVNVVLIVLAKNLIFPVSNFTSHAGALPQYHDDKLCPLILHFPHIPEKKRELARQSTDKQPSTTTTRL